MTRELRIYYIMLAAVVVWMLPGIFPLISYEGDSIDIVNGCELLYAQGAQAYQYREYGFWMQPLSYWMIVGFKYLLPFASCETIYCALSAVFAICLIPAIVALVHQITGVSRPLILVGLMFIPEIYADAMYPNSAVLPLLLYTLAAGLLCRGRYWQAGIMLCLAPLFRNDILQVYPFVPAFIYLREQNLRRTAVITLCIAVATCVIVVATYGSWLIKTADTFNEWTERVIRSRHYLAVIGFYGLAAIVLIPLGIVSMWRRQRNVAIFLVILPIILVHAINYRFGNASKHYIALMPFAAIALAWSMERLWSLRRNHRAAFWLSTVALGAYLLVSVVVDPTPNADGIAAQPRSWRPRVDVTLKAARPYVSAGIGAGMDFITADEVVLLTGNAFYPWAIHNFKCENVSRQRELFDFIHSLAGDDGPKPTLHTTSWATKCRINSGILNEVPDLRNQALLDTMIKVDYMQIDLPRFGQPADAFVDALGQKVDSIARDGATHYYTNSEGVESKYERIFEALWRRGRLVRVNDVVYRSRLEP